MLLLNDSHKRLIHANLSPSY